MQFYVTAARGTELALREELRDLRLPRLAADQSGCRFEGDWEDAWRVCLWSRIGQRVQVLASRFTAADAEALYAGVRQIDWTPFLTARHTLAVSAVCGFGALTHSGFIALKTKDAIVDQLREAQGERPAVDRDDPDLRVFVHIYRDVATVYLDLAGTPLLRRGYRTDTGEAPLKETLAAALLRLSEWDRQRPLVDPMCGSGTIPIEAALWAANIAPGLLRQRFGFERWASFDEAAAARLAALRGEARGRRHGQLPRILALDHDPAVLEAARGNARRAGVRLALRQAELHDLRDLPPEALVVSNPPYGERLAADEAFLRTLGTVISRLHGHRVCLLAGNLAIRTAVPLRPVQVHNLRNGDLPCEFLVYDVP